MKMCSLDKVIKNNLESSEPPKNKIDKKDDTVVNKQQDNNYDKPAIENTGQQDDAVKQVETNSDFEYSETGEFETDSHITNTDTKETFL